MKQFLIKSNVLSFVAFAIATLVFFKNAWVTEDAYIIFRSIEQLFAGNGPIWNPHERVQVFTSPLWYLVLAFTRIFYNNLYLNVIVISFILLLLNIYALKTILKNSSILLLAILLLSASIGFFDYTSSGLENILAYFIITTYILFYLKIFDNKTKLKHNIKITLFIFGLIICVRHDLALLLLPATTYIVFKNLKVFLIKQWVAIIFVSLSPFIAYSLFALIYYGFIFPNTAYAKLNTNIEQIYMLEQGLKYFYSSLKYDTITLPIIITALSLTFYKSSTPHLKYIAYGVILNLLYIIYIGGDFMQGRFFSYAYITSVILLMLKLNKINNQKIKISIFVLVCFYLMLYTHTPFNSPYNYYLKRNSSLIKDGIVDERGWHANHISLYKYITYNDKYTFPTHGYLHNLLKTKKKNKVIIIGNIGVFGYLAGIDKIIIDPLALSDPLLARMPTRQNWRIGHFPRKIPKGYIASITNNEEVILNSKINEFYKKLKIITQSKDLFTVKRLKTIILFNIGAYNYLLLDLKKTSKIYTYS